MVWFLDVPLDPCVRDSSSVEFLGPLGNEGEFGDDGDAGLLGSLAVGISSCMEFDKLRVEFGLEFALMFPGRQLGQ